MSRKEDRTVAGYEFGNDRDALLAREEKSKSVYIKSKLNFEDPQSVKIIYDKMIKNRIFSTPVGMDFLREVHDKLLESGMYDESDISSIPLYVAYTSTPVENNPLPSQRVKKQKRITHDYRAEYNISRVIIAILLLGIMAMFYITMHSDNPNILNYETAIKNKYATWEQDLTEREKIVREKERELGIEQSDY